MGKIECTKISGHFVQFALWFENGRFHWTLIRPRKKRMFLLLWASPLGSERQMPSLYVELSVTPFEGYRGISGWSLWGRLCPEWGGIRQHLNSICMWQESTRQPPVLRVRWRSSKQKRLGECPPKKGQPRSCLQATPLCCMHFFEQATTSSKDSFKKGGVSFLP